MTPWSGLAFAVSGGATVLTSFLCVVFLDMVHLI
jgi:hypothetical protein